MPRRASGRRDGDAIALVGFIWEISGGNTFWRISVACLVPILRNALDILCAKKGQCPALRGRQRESVQAPATDAHKVATYNTLTSKQSVPSRGRVFISYSCLKYLKFIRQVCMHYMVLQVMSCCVEHKDSLSARSPDSDSLAKIPRGKKNKSHFISRGQSKKCPKREKLTV